MMPKHSMSLINQFLLAAALVLCASMAVLGTWVNHQITRSVLAASGAGGEAFMRSLVEPHIQDFEPGKPISPEARQALDQIFVGTPLARSVVSVKLWQLDGTVFYSSTAPDVVGRKFVSSEVQAAALGKIVAEFEDMISAESAYEQTLGMSLIEVYAPLYELDTNRIIAVGEIYEDAGALALQLQHSRNLTWIVVCLITLMMLAILYAIVRRGSHVIDRQRSELRRTISEAQLVAAQNEKLRFAADQLRLDANEANEELISRIGSDLHDGPVQLLSLMMLRLEEVGDLLRERGGGTEAVNALAELTSSVIEEMRTLSSGLVLPEIGDLTIAETLRLVAERHENLTGTKVELALGAFPEEVSVALKICLYRVAQESLNNSFRHAGGVGQRIEARGDAFGVQMRITDRGCEKREAAPAIRSGHHLGLRGIRSRVEAFGGDVEILTSPGSGTKVEVRLPLAYRRQAHASVGSGTIGG
jgi:signal transduction histidine kinase